MEHLKRLAFSFGQKQALVSIDGHQNFYTIIYQKIFLKNKKATHSNLLFAP
jgi:hypothetical protein